MKVSLNWLNDHLKLRDQKTSELADLLTFAGIEVEGIEERGVSFENVVVGQIKSSEPHPKADRLSVCQVDDGSGQTRQIVCGAKNYKVGDKIPLALPGAELPGGFTIKKSKLRDVESEGMMCSGKELGLSDDHAGLLILAPDASIGVPIGDLFENDTLFDLEITPNRPDLLSHTGIARELAALTQQSLKKKAHFAEIETPVSEATSEQITLEAADQCPFYSRRIIRGVKVGPSPDWLRKKLEAVGLRPVNNVVDITNYVLLEMGQPLHAFDLAKLSGGIHVRLATEDETLLALDGQTYALETSDLVIADQSQAIAIGGVMGGEETGVTETTTDLLLESAYFDPASIRRTSRRLELSSDSSYRFERGVDPAQTAGASEFATALILEIAGGEAEPSLVVAGKTPAAPTPVTLDHARANRLMGLSLSPDEMTETLETLGLQRTGGGDSQSTFSIPTYRADLERHVDLVEEITRVFGIDRIPVRHYSVPSEASKEDGRYDQALVLRQQLASLGFFEAQTIKLIADSQLEDDVCGLRYGGQNEAVRLKRPLSQDHTTLRTSTIPGLLEVMARNLRMGATSLKFFEVGTVFSKHVKSPRALESRHLGIVLAGDMEDRSWHAGSPRPADLYDLIGLLEHLFAKDGTNLSLREIQHDGLLIAADVLLGKTVIGRAGQLWPARTRKMDWQRPAYVAEIDLAKIAGPAVGLQQVADLPKFPAITRDVAMEVANDLPNATVTDFFSKQVKNQPLLEGAHLFDLFTDPSGEKLPADRKSLAYSLTYRSPDRTLTSEEIDETHGKILAALQKSLEVKFR